MDEMIYIAMTGAKQTEYAQAINSNNLANISTTGFRADLHSFSSVPIEGPGVDTRVNAVVDSYGTDMSQGPVLNTGRDLDIAIRGDGFIAVQAPDGGEAYTRGREATEIVLANPNVKSLVVNFCGAFARTDVMTKGVIEALEQMRSHVPVFFSIRGTGSRSATRALEQRMAMSPYPTMDEAVRAAVEAARAPAQEAR